MDRREQAQEAAWRAINALPRPITKDAALAAAQGASNAHGYAIANEWFDQCWPLLLEKLNG